MKLVLTLIWLLLIPVAFVTPPKASAVSESVVIAQLQPGRSGAATEEFISFYNLSVADVEVTNWCVQYGSNTVLAETLDVAFTDLACITPPSENVELWLPAGGTVSFATAPFVVNENNKLVLLGQEPDFWVDFSFTAGMASLDRHIRLVDANKQEIDRVGWGSGAVRPEGSPAIITSSGGLIGRNTMLQTPDTDNNGTDFQATTLSLVLVPSLYEVEVPIDLCLNIGGIQAEVPDGFLTDEVGDCYEDVCPNIDELQVTLPAGYLLNEDEECEALPLEDRILFITELYPDAPSYDTSSEFIELYNPNDETINLAGYRLQLGPSFTKEYVFVSGEIKPGEYLTFSDIETSIVLPNDNGAVLRLIAPAGNTVSESAMYENAEDDTSWALVDDIWIFTNQITPGAANKPYVQPAVDEEVGVTSVLAPCPAGKYRNPETNRCRTIETAVASLTPCDEDEYRNPETNRCRKTATTSSTLTLCDEGEERNPETNRCRKVSVLGVSDENDLAAIGDVAVQSTPGQLNWPVILATLTATGGYMVYEWRNELRQKLMFARLRR